MSAGDFFVVLVIILSLIFLIRSEIVYHVSMKALSYVFDQENWEELCSKYLKDSYEKRIFQFNKWTFNQFFPGLKD